MKLSHALDQELDELLGELATPAIPSVLDLAPDSKGNIKLNRVEITALRELIKQMADVQLETACALTAMAQAFRVFGYNGEISSDDAYALEILASTQAGRSCDNVNLIRALISVPRLKWRGNQVRRTK